MKSILTKVGYLDNLDPTLESEFDKRKFLMRQYVTQCFCLTLSVLLFTSIFFTGCGGPVPDTLKLLGINEIKSCTLELELEPGTGCRYVANNEDFSFDFIFYVVESGAGFKGTVKTPTYSGPVGGLATSGGMITDPNGNVKTTITSTVAEICVGQAVVQDYRDFDLAATQKCFSASRNSDGSWTVNRLPLPINSE